MLASRLEDETVQQQHSQLWLALILVPLSLALSLLPSLPDWASKPTLAGIGVLEVAADLPPLSFTQVLEFAFPAALAGHGPKSQCVLRTRSREGAFVKLNVRQEKLKENRPALTKTTHPGTVQGRLRRSIKVLVQVPIGALSGTE